MVYTNSKRTLVAEIGSKAIILSSHHTGHQRLALVQGLNF